MRVTERNIPLTKSLGEVRVEQCRTQEDDDDERLDPAKMRRKVETNAIVVVAASERDEIELRRTHPPV